MYIFYSFLLKNTVFFPNEFATQFLVSFHLYHVNFIFDPAHCAVPFGPVPITVVLVLRWFCVFFVFDAHALSAQSVRSADPLYYARAHACAALLRNPALRGKDPGFSSGSPEQQF